MENNNDMCSSLHSRDERYVDEVTKNKLREHMKDPNSRITADDLANVNTNIFKTEEETPAPTDNGRGH